MATDNLIDVVDQLREIVQDLKRTLYGDHATRSTGLLVEFDSLRNDVKRLESDLSKVKNRRPNITAWATGYVAFCTAVVFAIISVMNQIDNHNILGLAPVVAMWLALLFGGAALVLFLVGFGWFEH